MAKAGDFEIDVSKPYPVWCCVSYRGKVLVQISHHELSDLEYAVKKAMQEAEGRLPESDRREVRP